MNQFTDRFQKELSKMFTYENLNDKHQENNIFRYNKNNFKDLPSEFNWHAEGGVSSVKGNLLRIFHYFAFNFRIFSLFFVNRLTLTYWYILLDQSVCGSGWSYAIAGAVEGAYFLRNRLLKRFSAQVSVYLSLNNMICYKKKIRNKKYG